MADIATTVTGDPVARRTDLPAAGRYPPLALVIALVVAIAVLPSSLRLPQSNPSQTLEYAPVPPDDETPPDAPPGNADQFGLGNSSTLEGDGALGGDDGAGAEDEEPPPPPDDDPSGQGRTPRTKRCVGNPPRQTEDPLSPPCVANFEGDNFGATATGVTRDEIRILIYWDGNTDYVFLCGPNNVTPDGEYFDLAEPAKPDEICIVRLMRNWMQYFNERYQTYGRNAHFYLYFGNGPATAETREADAAENYTEIKPFAILSTAEDFADVYLRAMARRKVLNFGSFVGREASFFNEFPKFIWGYKPTLEIQADQFITYLCTKVAPYPTSFGGAPSDPPVPDGAKRVYGLWRTGSRAYPGLIRLAARIKEGVARCGIEFAAEATFPTVGYTVDNRYTPDYATTAVADFRDKKVTTIIWPSGLETNLTKQLAVANYRPEIIALGDGSIENETAATYQDQTTFGQARVVTNVLYETRVEDEACWIAYKETDPNADRTEADSLACPIYNDLRQLFIGIQVAGPRLGPTNIDKGFHAIPKRASTDPKTPACFYNAGDYTCVKDAMVERWDPSANNQEGCFRSIQGGLRYLTGTWPAGEATAADRPDDPCNAYSEPGLNQYAPTAEKND